MSDQANNFSNSNSSARALRQSVKQSQAHESCLRVFVQFGQQLFNQGWNDAIASQLLHSLASLTSAEHALIALENMGKLTIHAQVGKTLPVGTRVPMMGTLAQMLKNPVPLQLHLNKPTQLWTHDDLSQQSCLLPLALGKHSKGIIGLSGKNLILTHDEKETLFSLAGLMGVMISQTQGSSRKEADLAIIERLTPREREIFALLPGGLSNIEIGEKLGIAAGTAKIHVERILNKLAVKDRTQAAVKAVELGYKA